jgi:hypothetical protein
MELIPDVELPFSTTHSRMYAIFPLNKCRIKGKENESNM